MKRDYALRLMIKVHDETVEWREGLSRRHFLLRYRLDRDIRMLREMIRELENREETDVTEK